MSSLGEHRFGLVLIGKADHVASIEGGKVEDRLPQANEDELCLPADQFPGFFSCLGFNQKCLGSELGVASLQVIAIDFGQFFARRLEAGLRSLDAFCRICRNEMFGAQIKGLSVVETKPDCGPLPLRPEHPR